MRITITSYLEDFLARGEAVVFAQRSGLRTLRWTGNAVAHGAFSFAQLLAQRGIDKGDRVLLSGANGVQWIIAFFACLLRGAIVVPLDLQSEPGFAGRVQGQVQAKLAVLDVAARENLSLTLPVIPLEELGTQIPAPCPIISDPTTPANEIAEIVFTSGTTAEPQGVVITQKNLLANLKPLETEIQPYLKWVRLVHPVRFLNLLPLSHVFGQLMGVFVPQLLRGEVFFSESLKPSEIIETVKRERISVIVCVPRLLDTLRDRVKREYADTANGSSSDSYGNGGALEKALRSAANWSVPRRWWEFQRLHRMFGLKFWAFICGGATLNPETEEFWQRLGFAVIQGYGLTETASLVSVNHPLKKKSGSIGAVMPGQEVKLSEQGEILVRGANVSPGHWEEWANRGTAILKNQTAQQSGPTNGKAPPDDGSWFHTGDVGEFDAKGNLYFKGRQKEVIVTSAGMNVYPEDLEAVLNQQPEIKSSVVIAISGAHGPEPVAVLLMRALSPMRDKVAEDAQAIRAIEHANKSLAEYQKIRRWFIWPEPDFPRTATQKIKKNLVAETIAAAALPEPVTLTSADPLANLIARVSGEPVGALSPNANLFTDLKLDSLGRVELMSAVEDRYQVEIDEASFSEAITVADLKRIIREGGTETGSGTLSTPLSCRNQKARVSQYPYPHWPHRWPINWFRILALHLIVFPFVRVMGRPFVKDGAKLKDQEGPFLFISNHVSMIDHALILWALPHRLSRRLAIAMDGEILREWLYPPPATGLTTRLRYRVQYVLVALFFNVFALPQHSGFRRSFTFAGEMMDRGYSVLVFPEGRRTPDGKLQAFRAGIGLLTKQLRAPVVPIRIEGVYELAQEGRHFARSGAVKVRIGEPVTYSAQVGAEQIVLDLEARVKGS